MTAIYFELNNVCVFDDAVQILVQARLSITEFFTQHSTLFIINLLYNRSWGQLQLKSDEQDTFSCTILNIKEYRNSYINENKSTMSCGRKKCDRCREPSKLIPGRM